MKRVTINLDLSRFRREKRRVGRPRFTWLETTMEKAFKWRRKKNKLRKLKFSLHNARHRTEVKKAAIKRNFPFDKKKNRHYKRKRTKPKTTESQGGTDGAYGTNSGWWEQFNSFFGSDEHRNSESAEQEQERAHQQRQANTSANNANAREGNRHDANRSSHDREALRRWDNLVRNSHGLWEKVGCRPTADEAKIRSAFRHKALEVHPDKPGGSAALFRATKQAAEKLLASVRDLASRYEQLVQLVEQSAPSPL